MQSDRQSQGKRGETRAVRALEAAGYTILDRNWHCTLGEIDIIARHGADVVFVEVRARSTGVDTALESVTRRKRNRLIQLANEYMNQHGWTDPYRIDVVAIDARRGTIEIIENAVGW